MVALNQITAFIIKDLMQVVRNRKFMVILLIYPTFSALVVPHIVNYNANKANVAYVDNDNSDLSRSITEALHCMEGEDIKVNCNTYAQAIFLLEENSVDCVLEIPADYEKTLISTGKLPELSLSVNAVEPVKALLGGRKVLGVVGDAISDKVGQKGKDFGSSTSYITESHYYNPSLNYLIYMLPVVLISVALTLCSNITGSSISSEMNGGGMDIINASPVSRTVFVSSKILTSYLLSLIELTITILLLQFGHNMVPAGSFLLVFSAFSIFVIGLSSFIILIGNLTANGTLTMQLSYVCLSSFQLMSGFLTPIESMHLPLQYLSYLNPCRHAVEIMRNVYLKSSTLADLGAQFLWLTGLSAAIYFIAVVTYRKRLV